MPAKIDEAVILVCIDQALQEAECYVARGNRGAADWWFNKADEYTRIWYRSAPSMLGTPRLARSTLDLFRIIDLIGKEGAGF
jgi:hypothetical protein